MISLYVGENLEKEPQIMELQNQVNKLSCVPLLRAEFNSKYCL